MPRWILLGAPPYAVLSQTLNQASPGQMAFQNSAALLLSLTSPLQMKPRACFWEALSKKRIPANTVSAPSTAQTSASSRRLRAERN